MKPEKACSSDMEGLETGESTVAKLLSLRNGKNREELEGILESLPEDKETHLWDHVFERLQALVINELASEEETSNKDACDLVGLILASCSAKEPTNPSLLVTAEYLHSVLSVLGDSNLKACILDLLTKWCKNKLNHWQDLWINTFVLALKGSLKIPAKKKAVSTVFSLREDMESLAVVPVEEEDAFFELLGKCAVSPNYLASAKGKQFVTSLLKSKDAVVRGVYRAVDKGLPYLTTPKVETLANCFLSAWKGRSEENTQALEESIQDVMLTAINLDESMPGTYRENLYKFLNVFHAQRSNMEISDMLFRLYQPILWRGLKGPNGIIRKSATRVFFDVFPLMEKCGVAARETEMRERCSLIRFLLKDPYPDVRVESVKGTMKAFFRFYGLFPYDEKKKIMSILLKKNGQDCNSLDSRRSLLNGLTTMLKNVHTHAQIRAIMPLTKHYLYDPAATVRVAYFSLLYAARRISGFKFLDVVSIEELLDLLVHASHEESRLVAQILLNTFFNPTISFRERMDRRLALVAKHPRVADRLYYEIAQIAPAQIVLEFLLNTCSALKVNFYVEKESVACAGSDEEDDEEDVQAEDLDSDKLTEEQVAVFLDTLAVMFTALVTKVKEVQCDPLKVKWKRFHVRMKRMLRTVLKAVKSVQLRLSCYYLATLLPDASEAVPTIGRQCTTLLQQIVTDNAGSNPETQAANLRACLFTVCRARKAADVLTCISDSLEQLVRQTPRRRVRFQVKNETPTVELDILKALLSMRETVSILFQNHLVPLFEIWTVLLRLVVTFRETLCQPDMPCNEDLLIPVFSLYLKISNLLSEKENPANKQKFDTVAALSCQMEWMREHLLPSVKDLPIWRQNTSVKYIQAFLESSEDCFKLDLASQEFADNMLDFMKMCKDLDLGELSASVAAVASTMDHAKLLFASDKEKELSLSAALASLTLGSAKERSKSADCGKENQEPSKRRKRLLRHSVLEGSQLSETSQRMSVPNPVS